MKFNNSLRKLPKKSKKVKLTHTLTNFTSFVLTITLG